MTSKNKFFIILRVKQKHTGVWYGSGEALSTGAVCIWVTRTFRMAGGLDAFEFCDPVGEL